MNLERALLWIILLPLLGAVINGTAGRYASRRAVHAVAVGSVALSFLLSLFVFGSLTVMRGGLESETNPRVAYDVYEWFSIQLGQQSIPIRVRFLMDALSGVMTLVVTGIGMLIHIYSLGYMSEEKSYARFFSYLNLFTASMLILVLASNMPLMFVGWEGVGLCSYLLIGFWFENRDYAAAGRKAFVANRIGDFGVLIGMFLLVATVGSFEFQAINEAAGSLRAELTYAGVGLGVSIATVAALFLFLGCTGKSAQIPLFVWLPDAMAGPTPVSALIHAATMVTAGVYLICRLSPTFAMSPTAMGVIAMIGALTAFLAATIASVQNQIKKVLAYSTVSQLGFMFAAVGVGAFAAGFFHVFTHAFFKACLFLGAGSVMHAVHAHGDADVRKLGGLRKYMPQTRWTFLASCMAIAGFPFTSGFFSKDEILLGTLSADHYFHYFPQLGPVVFAILVLAATMTAFYMFRLYFLTFSGEYRGEEAAEGEHEADEPEGHQGHHAAHEPHESEPAMTVPLAILGTGALGVGFLGLPHAWHLPNVWAEWLGPALGSIGAAHHGGPIPWVAMGFGTAAFLGGWGLAYVWYFQKQGEPERKLQAAMPRLHAFLMDKWRVDELYDETIIWLNKRLAVFSANFDKYFVDATLATLTSNLVRGTAFLFTRLQNGVVHSYGAVMVLGVALVGWWFTFPHAELDAAYEDGQVRYMAGAGMGYQYRFDFDADGRFDTQWQQDPQAQLETLSVRQLRPGVVVRVKHLGMGAASERYLEPGERLGLSGRQLGRWRRDEEGVLPYIEAHERALVIRPNAARVTYRGRAEGQAVRVPIGERVHVGETTLSVLGSVKGEVTVRNAFGYLGRESAVVTVPGPVPAGEEHAKHATNAASDTREANAAGGGR